MTSIITGDIINSRNIANQAIWQSPLKEILGRYGKSPKTWEIYRGDSFQIEIKNPEESLMVALYIKAHIRLIGKVGVRMGIGIGEKNYSAAKITHSNGEAFIHAADSLETLFKEKRTLAIMSPWDEFNREMNLILKLAMLFIDRWSYGAAEYVKVAVENPHMNQKEIGQILNIAQSSVSSRHRSARFSEVLEMDKLYREKIFKLTNE